MILRYPRYYENFSCIADKCEDTCCAGWEIDIDDKSYEYYMSIPGEYGEYILNQIKEYQFEDEDVYEAHGFILKEGKRCPFLNEKNLCDMILTLGEEAICDVCTYTPRNFLEYGNAREISISPSCAEAGRLIFGSSKKVTFVEREVDEQLDFEESQEDLSIAFAVRSARDKVIDILQDRKRNIYRRICMFLQFAYEVQQCLNANAFDEVLKLSKLDQDKINRLYVQDGFEMDQEERYSYFEKRMDTFCGMESINEEWQQYIACMQTDFIAHKAGKKKYLEAFMNFTDYLNEKGREYEYEQLLVYYAFLSLSRCVDDLNFWGKAQFAVISFLMTRDMDIERFYQNKGEFTLEDRVDIARIYAKEVEHSEENLEYLEDEFLFEESYHLEDLCKQILPQWYGG